MSDEIHYTLTVRWCNKGQRGIFCSDTGNGFFRTDRPHTEEEMWEILGPFDLILSPESLPMTAEEVGRYNQFIPLREYSNKYGIAVKSEESKQ